MHIDICPEHQLFLACSTLTLMKSLHGTTVDYTFFYQPNSLSKFVLAFGINYVKCEFVLKETIFNL